MITLYIKTHRITGLKYFGKTTKKNPVSYKGSGKYWLRHIKKYGNEVDTEIYLQTEDIDEVTREALKFSRENNIVESEEWANLIEENGFDGLPKGLKRPDIAEKMTGKKRPPFSEEWIRNMIISRTGRKNPKAGEKLRGRKRPEVSAKLRGQKRPRVAEIQQKEYLIIYPDGETKQIINLAKFCRENGLNHSCMCGVGRGERKQHKGFRCEGIKNNE